MKYEPKDKLLSMEGAKNIRDLGGYKTKDGRETKYGRMLRSALLHRISDNDKKTLTKYGLKTIIDLRSYFEAKQNPDPFISKEIKYYNISIGDIDLSKSLDYGLSEFDFSSYYILMAIESKSLIKEVFETILENKDRGTVLIHCTAGKDRTGIISALLLLMANVQEEDVITNYSESYNNLKSILDEIKKECAPNLDERFLFSERKYIKDFIEYIIEKHKSINNFFKNIGFNEKEIKDISNILL